MFPKCQHFTNICFIILYLWQFFAGQVVKAPHFHCRGPRFNPWLGSYNPTSCAVSALSGLEVWGRKGPLLLQNPISLCTAPASPGCRKCWEGTGCCAGPAYRTGSGEPWSLPSPGLLGSRSAPSASAQPGRGLAAHPQWNQ